MRFSFKPVIILACLIVFCSPHVLLGAQDELVFLLPKDKEDPLKLRPFLQNYAPALTPLYEQIQTAKASADTEALLLLKERFIALSPPGRDWQILINQLTQEVKGDPVNLWPGQNAQQSIGSILFYPQELISISDSSLLCYPGLAASLAISASMGNPVATYELSSGYADLARECRREPQDVDQEMEIDSQDRRQSSVLKAEALRIFEQAMVTNKVAEFYVNQNAYEEHKIPLEEFAAYLHSTDLPQAYFTLGRLYENKHLSAHKNQPNAPDEDQLAYIYYRKALKGGYQDAIFGIHRLLDELDVESKDRKSLYEQGGGEGIFLAAESQKEKRRNFEEAKRLYERSGELGRLYSYITLGDEILLHHISSAKPEHEAISYYLKTDRQGYAEGSRNIYASPRLCPTHDAKLEVLKRMMNFRYVKGYEWALVYLKDEGQYLEEDFRNLLIERAKILTIVDSIGKPSSNGRMLL